MLSLSKIFEKPSTLIVLLADFNNPLLLNSPFNFFPIKLSSFCSSFTKRLNSPKYSEFNKFNSNFSKIILNNELFKFIFEIALFSIIVLLILLSKLTFEDNVWLNSLFTTSLFKKPFSTFTTKFPFIFFDLKLLIFVSIFKIPFEYIGLFSKLKNSSIFKFFEFNITLFISKSTKFIL